MHIFGAGRTFLVTDRRAGSTHLWLVLTDPDPKTNHIVAVMMVTARDHTDKTVALRPGDHPWIKHESHVAYGTAVFMPISKLIETNNDLNLVFKADLKPAVLQRVRQGLLESSRTINAIRDYCAVLFGP